MSFKSFFVCILYLLVPSVIQSENFSKYNFKNITQDLGFTSNGINAICTDLYGVIWIGTNNGLFTYNGQTFRSFKYYNAKLFSSSNNINYIFRDSKGLMWICTTKYMAVFDYKTANFHKIKLPFSDSQPINSILEISKDVYVLLHRNRIWEYNNSTHKIKLLSSNIQNICYIDKLANNLLILGTKSGAIYTFNPLLKTQADLLYQHYNDAITSICYDQNRIYVGYKDNGIDVINAEGLFIKNYIFDKNANNSLPCNSIKQIQKINNNEIWFLTNNGILAISDNYQSRVNINNYFPSNTISTLYKDLKENIWIGSSIGCMAVYNPFHYSIKQRNTLNGTNKPIGTISSFAFKDENSIWIGSETYGLLSFDIYNETITKQIPLDNMHIKSLFMGNDCLWIGTINKGIYYKTKFSSQIKHLEIDSLKGKYPIIVNLFQKNNFLWIATRNMGIVRYDLESHKCTIYQQKNHRIGCNNIWQIYINSLGDIYASTDNGLYRKKHMEDIFRSISIGAKDFEDKYCYCFLLEGDCTSYAGSKNRGILQYDYLKSSFIRIDNNSKLNNYVIYSIQKDIKNRIWMSTNNGIIYYDVNKKKLVDFSNFSDYENKYQPLSCYYTYNNMLLWGGTDGFSYLKIENMIKNPHHTKVFPSQIKINNLDIRFNKNINCDFKYTPKLSRLILKYNENNLSFHYIVDNITYHKSNKIEYILEGHQNRWTQITQNDEIKFSAIPPGKYILKVKGCDDYNQWNDYFNQIEIIILPPFYKTKAAYVVYFLFLIAIFYYYVKMIKVRINLNKQIETEKYKSCIKSEILEQRMKFFVNMSHEFRTPLNLINTPLKEIEKKDFDEDTKFNLSTIRRNTDNLLNLTEQILDVRLLEINSLKVNKNIFDLNKLCKDVIDHFEYYVISKRKKLIFRSDVLSMLIDADYKKIEKVVYNLISNALKFSNENSCIIIENRKTILKEEDYASYFYIGNKLLGKVVQIIVTDEGCGIKKENFNDIFERFKTFNSKYQEGTGIGLHICKEFVFMHKGNIFLKSTLGKGSIFIINIPLFNDIKYIKENSVTINTIAKLDDETLFTTKVDNELKEKKPLILIFNDSDETIYYLKKSLSNYRCISANNGKVGIELCRESDPALIIMDISMPIINGIECIKILKKDNKTMNIPIIVISSFSDTDTQYNAIDVGADAFLLKPIEEKLLITHIKKLLYEKYNLKKMFDKGFISINESSQTFMERLNNIIDENLHNWDFDVNTLAEKMNTSHSSLFRKIKAETNSNITDYIRDMRLNRAVSLIKKGMMNTEEIALACGFNSSSYFCKCFKRKYGKTPKDYIKSNQN